MADKTLTDGAYRALLVQDSRITYSSLDLDNSVLTQAGSRAGVPIPAQATGAVLVASGEQEDTSMTITTVRGGISRSDAESAGFTWTSDEIGEEVGWEAPNAIFDVEPVNYSTSCFEVSAVRMSDGTIGVAFTETILGSLDITYFSRRGADGTWSTKTLVKDSASLLNDYGSICLTGDVDLLRLYIITLYDTESQLRISLYTSKDQGDTWEISSGNVLQTSDISTGYPASSAGEWTPRDISVAHGKGGQSLMLLTVESGDGTAFLKSTVMQFASSDGGWSFSLVEAYECDSANDVKGGTSYRCLADPSGAPGFFIFWASADTLREGRPYVAKAASCFSPFSTLGAEAVVSTLPDAIATITSQRISRVPLTVAVDPGGLIWLIYSGIYDTTLSATYITLYAGNDEIPLKTISGATECTILKSGVDSEYLSRHAAVYDKGKVHLLAISKTDGTYDGGLVNLRLGGFNTSTRPPINEGFNLTSASAPYEFNWLASANFAALANWVVSTVGAPPVTVTSAVSMLINCSAGVTMQYTATTSNYVTDNAKNGHYVVLANTTAGNAFFTVKVEDQIHIRIAMSTTQVIARNMETGLDIITLSRPSTDPNYIRLEWDGSGSSSVVVLRVADRVSGDGIPSWTSGNSLVARVVSANSRVQVNISYPSVLLVYHLSFANGDLGYQLGNQGLSYRPYSSVPSPIHHGVSVGMLGGPTISGDSWSISPRYDYGVRRIFQEIDPSPRSKWKSTAAADAVPTVLILDLRENTEATRMTSPILGVGFYNANFRYAEVYTGTSSSGPWTLVGDFDLSCGYNGLAWARTGLTVSAPASTPDTGPFFVRDHALAGSSFYYSVGEMATITGNSGGIWQNGNDVKRPRVMVDYAPPGTTGTTGAIVFKDVVGMIYGTGNVSYLRIVFPAQDTASGVLELGNLMIGGVEILGRQYSRGRTLEISPNAETVTANDGTRRTRKLGPSRRVLSVSWQDNAIDTTQVWGNLDNVDYVRASAGETPAAYVAATAYQVAGLIEKAEGQPITLISRLTPDEPSVIGPNSILRGRVLGPVAIDAVLGDEEESEIVRVANIAIEEEV